MSGVPENWRSLDQGRQMDAAKRFLRWNRDQRASPELLGLIIGAAYAGENVLWAVKRQREEEVIWWLYARFISCCLAALNIWNSWY